MYVHISTDMCMCMSIMYVSERVYVYANTSVMVSKVMSILTS